MDKEIKNKLIEISKKYNLNLLILFGSRANNTNDLNSDWDLAFISKNKIDKIKLVNELELILKNVDLIDLLDNVSILLKKEIFENGIVIFEKYDGYFDDKKLDIYFEYRDQLDYLKEYQNYLENNLKIE